MTKEMKDTMKKINKLKTRLMLGKIKNEAMAKNHIYILELKLNRLAKENLGNQIAG